MEVMISVNPPYSDMILSGYKPYEFRKQVLKGMDEGYPLEPVKAYIYETKNKGGVGAVVGEVTVDGAYAPNYGKDSKTDTYVVERNECIKAIYRHWCNMKGLKPNMNEGWFKSKRFSRYMEEIGYAPEQYFNYALILAEPRKYKEPVPIGAFSNISGEPLVRPPQNMCRVGYLRKDG